MINIKFGLINNGFCIFDEESDNNFRRVKLSKFELGNYLYEFRSNSMLYWKSDDGMQRNNEQLHQWGILRKRALYLSKMSILRRSVTWRENF